MVPIGADAHVRVNVKTSLVLRVSDNQVPEGTKVSFGGQLKSPWIKCVKNRKVKLLRNGNKLGVRRTNATGQVLFRRQLFHTGTFKLRFAGRQWGKHPHRHSCRASNSRKIRVTVT
jgi:hypothetical protein